MKIRPANTRGVMQKSWITSLRTFSNNDYWNPRYMNWGSLKVINDDTQQPGGCVPNHEHKNYDIFGYIVSGTLKHTDSLGNNVVAQAGQIQHMWAGSSIWHTESCVGNTPARYLQIWFTPNRELNSKPYYNLYNKAAEFGPIDIPIHCDMSAYGGVLTDSLELGPSYVYVVDGTGVIDNIAISTGDGAEITDSALISPVEDLHILVFKPAKFLS